MNRKAVLTAAVTLALGVPAFAGPAGRDTADRASQRIERAQAAIAAEAAKTVASDAPVERRGRAIPQTARQRALERAQAILEIAQRQYEQGDFDIARRQAERAEWLAWSAANPRKGEK